MKVVRGRVLPDPECFSSPEIPMWKGDLVYRDRTFMSELVLIKDILEGFLTLPAKLGYNKTVH